MSYLIVLFRCHGLPSTTRPVRPKTLVQYFISSEPPCEAASILAWVVFIFTPASVSEHTSGSWPDPSSHLPPLLSKWGTPSPRHGVADPGPIQVPSPRRRPHPCRCQSSNAYRRSPRALVPAPLPVCPVAPWARQGSFVYPTPLCLCYIFHSCISEWVIVMRFFSDSCACALRLIDDLARRLS